jgi:hypothetical protein
LLILERIDGFVYAGVLTTAFLVTASGARRREMVRHIAVPASVVFLAYHGWRWWYFQDLVPAPVEAKILYKPVPQRNVVIKGDGLLLRARVHQRIWMACGARGSCVGGACFDGRWLDSTAGACGAAAGCLRFHCWRLDVRIRLFRSAVAAVRPTRCELDRSGGHNPAAPRSRTLHHGAGL